MNNNNEQQQQQQVQVRGKEKRGAVNSRKEARVVASSSSSTNKLEKWGRMAEKEVEGVLKDTEVEFANTFKGLFTSLQGAKLDTLLLLLITSAVIPVFKFYNISSILGFLLFGTLLGPNCLNWLKDVHMIDILGELGIVFFLFEIGLELSLERLMAMKKDVFGLGTSQFLLTSLAGTLAGRAAGLSTSAAVTVGGSMALSSSAFVLQLLKDKNAMGTRVGRASFGILLLQDLAVVPLLVVVELLAKGGSGLGKALGIAGVKTVVAVSTMSFAGRKLLDPIFYFVARSSSQEAFLSIILSTVLLMSFITQGIGLSNTLGAFLAGLLLAETKYRYQVESDIAPFRGILLGFFFITVGFSIDPRLVLTSLPKIGALLLAVLGCKAGIITALSLANGLTFSESQQTGILNAQVGEFAFVAFAIAERSSLISPQVNKILLTTVALSMAVTPLLEKLGAGIAAQLDKGAGLSTHNSPSIPLVFSIPHPCPPSLMTHHPPPSLLVHQHHHAGGSGTRLPGGLVLTQEPKDPQTGLQEAVISEKKETVLVVGYGRVGKMVCDMLDRQLIPYVAIDNSPQRAKEARKAGLPVYFGDANRPDVLKSFHAESARACVVTIDDQAAITKAVESITKMFPKVPVIARAINTQHQKRLVGSFANVYALCPMLPEDSVLLTLPFGGAVLQQIGVSKPEIDAILEDFRFQYMEDSDETAVDFFTSWQKRLPPSIPASASADEGEEGGAGAEVKAEDALFDPVDESLTALQEEPPSPPSSADLGLGLSVDDTIDVALMGGDVSGVVEEEGGDPRLPFEG